jgi:hypothetical protein
MTVPGKGGRPTDYREEYNEKVYKLCLLGATDKEIGDFFDVTEQTVNNWKKDYPLFFESIKSGKAEADANVASRLYSRAMGFIAPDTKIATHEGQITDTIEVEKHYPPDPTAAIFWLKNRQPDKWRDKQEIDTNISGGIEVSFTSPDLDEYAK